MRKKKLVAKESASKLMASVFFFGKRIATSYLPPDISASMEKMDVTKVKSPNSVGVYNLESKGETKMLKA